ncbi:hypothetical protein MLD52_10935 [Puniceicoccaceae bacterium K14]|nr:hypothetical protein [Puniceicoccaceae bacterium K14]
MDVLSYFYRLFPKLATLLAVGSVLTYSLSGADSEEKWNWFKQRDYIDCKISNDGKYVSIKRRIPFYSAKEERRAREERYVSLPEFMYRVYVLNLESGKMVLAGPADDPKKGQDFKKNVLNYRWMENGNLILELTEDLMEVSPQTGDVVYEKRIHGYVQDASIVSLPSRLDKPILFTEGSWSRGRAMAFWSSFTKSGKVKKLPSDELIKDIVIRNYYHEKGNVLTVSSTNKSDQIGFTFQLEDNGQWRKFPFNLGSEWQLFDDSVLEHEEENIVLVCRILGGKEQACELKLFNYETNELLEGSVFVNRSELDALDTLVTLSVVDALKASSESKLLSEVCDPLVLSTYKKLKKGFPLGSCRIFQADEEPTRMLVNVTTVNKPGTWYYFDANANRLVKVIDSFSEIPVEALAKGETFSFNIDEETTGEFLFLPALEDANGSTIVWIEPMFSFENDWYYSRHKRYLNAEGYDVLVIRVPYGLQLAAFRSTKKETFLDALSSFSNIVDSALKYARQSDDIDLPNTRPCGQNV